jgi:hypothetical protein
LIRTTAIIGWQRTSAHQLTAPGGKPYGSVKALIDCPVIGYLTTEPTEDLIKPAPGSAVDFGGAYFQG